MYIRKRWRKLYRQRDKDIINVDKKNKFPIYITYIFLYIDMITVYILCTC